MSQDTPWTIFRPCIDVHDGKVKQIVGGSLRSSGAQTNFISDQDATYYADLYCQQNLTGGHIISLGPNNEQQVLCALNAYPKGLQYGGGVTPENAEKFLSPGLHILLLHLFYLMVANSLGRD